MALSARQRQHLKALSHHLDPVVQIGHEGLTDGVTAQVDDALTAHELIKVRLGTEAPIEQAEAAEALSEATTAEVVQIIGRVVVLYRRRPVKPKVELPGAGKGKGKASRAAGKSQEGSKGRSPAARKRKTSRRATGGPKKRTPKRTSQRSTRVKVGD